MLTDRSRIARSLCSALAIATATLMSAQTHAQTAAPNGSFQGNGTFNSGSGSITLGTNTTTINVTSPNAVIDWSTFDTATGGGPINFQPSSTTATFQSFSNFSVLNRILPTDPSRAVQFNGTVVSQIQGTTTTPGGTVYFYSPGGVIVGSSAVFNVGNLGLTSAAPQVVGGVFEQVNPVTGSKFVNFTAANSGTGVIIQPGAQITSGGANGSYVAIVAPTVNNAGTLSVNGATALVSADAATITFNPNGLFDIQVTSGTSSTGNSGNGRTLINTGSITGPAYSGTGALHRAYLVAVPKNTAITMIIGEGTSLGFNIAGAADVVGNAVILSAGYDVTGGQVQTARSAGGGTGTVAIDAYNAAFTSDVRGRATGRALFAAGVRATGGAGTTSFAAGVAMHSDTIVSLEARASGTISVAGSATLDADQNLAALATATTGGQAYLDSRNGGSLTVGGDAVLSARGQGGNATGGNASATALANGIINVAGVLRVRADGIGGNGGSGTGGTAAVNAQTGGDIISSQLNVAAIGVGGSDTGTGAGSGTGGSASVFATGTGSTISVANGNSTGTPSPGGLDFLSASGFGGVTNGGGSGVGGAATGGTANLSATAGGVITGPANTGTPGFVRIIARAFGGDANAGIAGGLATGGIINITVDNATFTSADLLPSSFALGGSAAPTAVGTINGGNAVGGQRNISVRNGATATTSFSGGGPGAQGGNATASGRGGDASGGSASLVVDNATLTLSGRSVVFSQNISGSGGTAGNAIAGTAYGQVSNGGTLTVPDDASVVYDFSVLSSAFGPAAGAVAGNAQGNVTAGNATLLLQGGTINGPGSISVQASAAAMTDQYSQGGTYLGGQASLLLQGGTISSPTVYVAANAAAGAVGAGLVGTGGSATGGTAQVVANANISGLFNVTVESLGIGGDILGAGTGGAGTGGDARIGANPGATLNISGNATLTTNGTGGSGTGAGSLETGGAGAGGSSVIVARAGSVRVAGATTIGADAIGGNGANGGTGGAALAGFAAVDAQNNLAGASNISLQALVVSGNASGGLGGAGLSGQAGGAGGAAIGGAAQAFGNAGNGQLVVAGSSILKALAWGGNGGVGGAGAAGATGGAGGDATGGSVTVGTRSGLDTGATNTGSASFDVVSTNSSGVGGNGGAGGSGTTLGNGGNGGVGVGGSAVLLVRGSPVTTASVSLAADAFGGAGGTGAIAGIGGSATVGNNGGVGIIATSRFQHPEQPGSLTTGNIFGQVAAVGGTGSILGASIVGDSPATFQVDTATANLAEVLIDVTGTQITGTVPSAITLNAATVNIPGTFALTTPGALSLTVGSSAFNVGTFNLSASNFLFAPTRPTTLGTINVSNGLSISSQLDFLAYANFAIGFNATLNTVGAISIGDVTVNGTLQASAGTTFTAGNISASDVTLQGATGLTTGTISAAERIKLTAPQGPITTGALQAGDTVKASASGALSVASASAGIVNPSTNSAAEYNVLLRSLTSVTAGNLAARANIGLASPGTITVGNLSAGGLGILALAGTGLTTGSISAVNPATGALTGRIYLANFSMEALGGQIVQNFDPAPVLAATPVAIAGPVTINGSASGSVFQLAATGAITTGAIASRESIEIVGGAAITSGALVAGDTVEARAVGALSVASASAGIVNPSTATGADYTVALRSLASITAGALTARANVGLSSPGSITVGNISANQIVLALAGTGLTTGSITTLASGRTYLANFSMEALGGQITQSFDPVPILAASPASIAGPIAVGAVSTGTFQAATSQAFSSGNITTAAFTSVIADGSLSTGALTAGQTVSLQSGAALGTGAVQAGDAVGIAATGAVSTGTVSAGIVNPSTNSAASYKIAIASQTGAISTGTLTARRDVGLQAAQGIATGDIAGRDVLLLAGAGVTTGSILAGSQTQPTGRVYIGNFSMARAGANVFSPFSGPLGSLPIFNLQPVRIGGAITIGGAVAAGSLFAAAAQGISLQAVTTPAISTQTGSGGFIDLDSGGTVTVNGRLAAGRRIDIASRDIDIGEGGSIDALGSTGEILLASNNPNGAFIGDGLTTSGGYMLSNAEYARLKAGQIAVVGIDQVELATDLTIGTLTINASQLYGTNGTALFASGNRTTQTPSGILRIAGAVTASGFTATNEVDLLSGTVELEAEKGSLKIDNGSGGLGGQIVFEANHVHVASDAILTKLRADPLYEGHIKELNAPSLVQRTDGVLNALNLDFSSKSQTVYVQNTGSVAVPAGVLTRLDSNTSSNTNTNNTTSNEGVRPPGGSEFVINGQIQTNTGIVTGKAAFDLVIASLKAEAVADGKTFASDLTPTSTFNGCVISTGVCAFGNADPVAALSSEITVVTNATLDESPVAPAADDSDEGDDGSGDKDDEDSKSDEGSSPIAPPAPLISTRALDGNVNVVEPVSGAGNPALFGSAVDETTAQGEKP